MLITLDDIKMVVSECTKSLIAEIESGTLSLRPNSNIHISFIGRDDIIPISDTIWNMLVLSYENIGGIKTYNSKEDFLRKVKYAKIAYNGDTIVACAIYRSIEGSYKMVAIGCNQNDDGKCGIQEIIKYEWIHTKTSHIYN